MNLYPRLAFLLVFALVPLQSPLAFINIESLRQGIESGFSGSSGTEISGASGNTDVFELGLNSRNIYKKNQREYILIGTYEYGEASELKNANKGEGHARYAQGFSESWKWEIFGQVEFNEFQNLELRSLLGGGLRSNLFSDKKNSLYLGVGLFYEDETLKNTADQANFRMNFYLSFRSLINQGVEFIFITYYQPNTQIITDERFRVTTGLEVKISKSLSMVSTYNFARDTKPPPGVLLEDSSYRVGFNYTY